MLHFDFIYKAVGGIWGAPVAEEGVEETPKEGKQRAHQRVELEVELFWERCSVQAAFLRNLYWGDSHIFVENDGSKKG